MGRKKAPVSSSSGRRARGRNSESPARRGYQSWGPRQRSFTAQEEQAGPSAGQVRQAIRRDQDALLLLKNGEFGGLEWSVRQRLLGRLRLHYDVLVGRRYSPSRDEALQRGASGLSLLVERAREAGLDVREALQIIDQRQVSGAGEQFGRWIESVLAEIREGRLRDDQRIRGLAFLWNLLQEDAQYLALSRKPDISRQHVIDAYGISRQEAEAMLDGRSLDSVSEQEFVDGVLVGPSSTEEAPVGTLRNLVYEELRFGALTKTVAEGRAWGAANRTIMASANAVHSAGTEAELAADYAWLERRDGGLASRLLTRQIPARGPPATLPTLSGQPLSSSLNAAYEPSVAVQAYGPAQIADALARRADELAGSIRGDDPAAGLRRDLLAIQHNGLVSAMANAFRANGDYTFYHGLIAITRLLPFVVRQLDDSRTNLYLARDGANYWLTKRLMEGDRFDASRNLIIHVSREKLGLAHEAMAGMIAQVRASGATPERFYDALLERFSARMAADPEFRRTAETLYADLQREGLSAGAAGRVRLVESMSEGIITGFIKTVILYYDHRADVQEFLVAPK